MFENLIPCMMPSQGFSQSDNGSAIIVLIAVIIFLLFGIRYFRKDYSNQNASNNATVPTQFLSLLGYGKFISGIGWFIIVCSILFSIASAGSSGGTKILFIIIGSFFSALTGFLLVVSGQLISCFVSIEKNTRLTSLLLKEQNRVIQDS